MKYSKLITKAAFIVSAIALSLISCNTEVKIDVKEVESLKESVKKTSANWQLFLDDYWVSSSDNLSRTLHQPEKNVQNPIIRADVPWEQNPYCFGTVIYDEEESLFKFWYQSYNSVGVALVDKTPILYATSVDGVEWNRPDLGIFEFENTTKNNIVLQNYGFHDLYSPSVIKDLDDPNPDKRYKMIWWDFPLGDEGYQDDGMCVAFSTDGVHWVKHPGNPVISVSKKENSISDVMSVMRDKNTGKYVAYTKGWAEPWPAHRQIVRVESEDFIHWSEPEVVIRHEFNLKDPQSYGMTTSQYGNNYIGMMYSYKKPGNETIDVQIAVSHDNKNWDRVANQETFLPLGEDGSWDDGMLFTTPLFNHEDKTMIYYGGWDNSHDSTERRRSGIGLATLRLNGFVSLDAKNNGSIITNTLLDAEGPLLVNANAAGGELRAELLDGVGHPIPGYTIDDCLPISSDDISHWIKWRKHEVLPNASKPIQIRFEFSNTSLYGFYAGSKVELKMSK